MQFLTARGGFASDMKANPVVSLRAAEERRVMDFSQAMGCAVAGAAGELFRRFCTWYRAREDARIAAEKAAPSNLEPKSGQ